MEQPDNWIILKIQEDSGHFYKVLAGWSGGYLYGDSWRLNSGIVKIEQSDTHYDFIGESGSVYRCHKETETIRMNIDGVLDQLLERFGDKISVVNAKDIIEEFKCLKLKA